MSDHWNSLADMLGTPSIDPLQRKASTSANREKDSPRKPSEETASPAAAAESPPMAELAVRDEPAQQDAIVVKPESPSRLRSSWDTVARLFGVVTGTDSTSPTAPTPTSASESGESTSSAGDDVFAGFGRKSERPRNPEPARDRPPQAAAPERSADRDSTPRRKKPSTFWDSPEPTDAPPAPMRASQPERGNPIERPTLDDDAPSGTPDRRGRTRNIRRGRDIERTDEPIREGHEPTPDSNSSRERARPEPRSENRTEGGARRGERAERPVEGSRNPRSDAERSSERVSRGGDRPSRDASERPSRGDDRPERTADRSTRIEKHPDKSDLPSPARSSDRTHRDDVPVSDVKRRDRPSRGRTPPRTESVRLDEEGEWDSSEVVFESDDEVVERDVLPETKDEDDATQAAPRRRRRRRGSSSRREPAASERDDNLPDDAPGQAYGRKIEEDDDDGDEVENLRIHKVTSWLDAISSIIDANMENHKRNPSQDRGRGGNRGGGGGGNSRRRGSGGGGPR